jgi:hypothetical protein
MRAIDRVRAGWYAIARSPRRTAVAAATVVGALAVGVGFSLAVNAMRDDGIGQPPSASPVARTEPSRSAEATPALTPWATPQLAATATPGATPTATALPATPEPTPVATVAATPVATSMATPIPTAHPLATLPPATGDCDEITIDRDGFVFVNGQRVEDPWEETYGEQMPMAVLRLAARATGATGATACLQVELTDVVVSGSLEICGDVVAQRLAPLPTPTPDEPGSTMPPRYGEPTIAGVPISDRMLDVDSYPMLDIADVVDVPVCLAVMAASNDVHLTFSVAICEMMRLAEDGSLTVNVGDQEWSFVPEYIFDDAGALPLGQRVEAGLDVRIFRDDVNHLIELAVWATSDCA